MGLKRYRTEPINRRLGSFGVEATPDPPNKPVFFLMLQPIMGSFGISCPRRSDPPGGLDEATLHLGM